MGKVCVCIFHKEDARSVEQRLEVAVNRYLQEYGQECRLSDASDRDILPDEIDKGVLSDVADKGMLQDMACKGMLPENLQIARTEKGKPYFSNCPQIQFSISHSGEYWTCAVADEKIGLDLQQHTLARNETREAAELRLQKMAKRFYHSTEVNYVEVDCFENFFAVWAAREAYVKFTGEGIDRHFSEYCVIPDTEMRQKVFTEWKSEQRVADTDRELPVGVSEMPAALVWEAMKVHFWETIYPEGYALCVCTENRSDCRIIVCDDI